MGDVIAGLAWDGKSGSVIRGRPPIGPHKGEYEERSRATKAKLRV
jgi:hypothetical protein